MKCSLPPGPTRAWSTGPAAGSISVWLTGLGHSRFVAHGSDLGARVTTWKARRHSDAVTAIHLATPSFPEPPTPRTQAGTALPAGDLPPVPTAVSIFGGEQVPFPKPPRELAERYVQVTAWHDEPFGGHFPAVAAPSRLAAILRDTLRPHRPE